jgi:hypothetical protein
VLDPLVITIFMFGYLQMKEKHTICYLDTPHPSWYSYYVVKDLFLREIIVLQTTHILKTTNIFREISLKIHHIEKYLVL